METLNAISLRKSVRNYKPEQISDEVLDIIVKAGFKAPVGSSQYDSLHITVIQNEAILKRIAIATSDSVYQMINVRKNMDFGAKTLIMVSSTPARVPGIEYANAACVLENMILAATDQNVDSILWAAATAVVKQDQELKKILEIPEGFSPVLCASFGYATTYEAPKEHTISVNVVR